MKTTAFVLTLMLGGLFPVPAAHADTATLVKVDAAATTFAARADGRVQLDDGSGFICPDGCQGTKLADGSWKISLPSATSVIHAMAASSSLAITVTKPLANGISETLTYRIPDDKTLHAFSAGAPMDGSLKSVTPPLLQNDGKGNVVTAEGHRIACTTPCGVSATSGTNAALKILFDAGNPGAALVTASPTAAANVIVTNDGPGTGNGADKVFVVSAGTSAGLINGSKLQTTIEKQLQQNVTQAWDNTRVTCTKACNVQIVENPRGEKEVQVMFSRENADGSATVVNGSDASMKVSTTRIVAQGAETRELVVAPGQSQYLGRTLTFQAGSNVFTKSEPFAMELKAGETLTSPDLGDLKIICGKSGSCTVAFDPDTRTFRVDHPGKPTIQILVDIHGGTIAPPVRVIVGCRPGTGLDAGVDKSKGDVEVFVGKDDRYVAASGGELKPGSPYLYTELMPPADEGKVSRKDWLAGLGNPALVADNGSTDTLARTPLSGMRGLYDAVLSEQRAAESGQFITNTTGPASNNNLNADGNSVALSTGASRITSRPAGAFAFSNTLTLATPLASHGVNTIGALSRFSLDWISAISGTAGGTLSVCSSAACPAPQTVRWGTWSSGTVDDGISPVTVTPGNPLHYLIGSATSPGVIDARTGTVSFAHIGGTQPTGRDGTTYSASVGSLSVNFTAATANLTSYSVTPVAGPSSTSYAFTNVPLSLTTITGTTGSLKALTTGFSSAAGTNNGLLQVEGLFLGATGNHVGAALNISSSSVGGVGINSVQVFKQP